MTKIILFNSLFAKSYNYIKETNIKINKISIFVLSSKKLKRYRLFSLLFFQFSIIFILKIEKKEIQKVKINYKKI